MMPASFCISADSCMPPVANMQCLGYSDISEDFERLRNCYLEALDLGCAG